MLFRVVIFIFLLVLGLAAIRMAINAIINGYITNKYLEYYERDRNPYSYWFNVLFTLFIGIAAILIGAEILMVKQ